jgi:hypothetical protein
MEVTASNEEENGEDAMELQQNSKNVSLSFGHLNDSDNAAEISTTICPNTTDGGGDFGRIVRIIQMPEIQGNILRILLELHSVLPATELFSMNLICKAYKQGNILILANRSILIPILVFPSSKLQSIQFIREAEKHESLRSRINKKPKTKTSNNTVKKVTHRYTVKGKALKGLALGRLRQGMDVPRVMDLWDQDAAQLYPEGIL